VDPEILKSPIGIYRTNAHKELHVYAFYTGKGDLLKKFQGR